MSPRDRIRVRCLIVDDVEDNLIALAALLRGDGVEIRCARSGPEALELLLVDDFALAMIDVQMPGMDGFELAELMRGADRTKHVPIIFVTAGTAERKRLFRGYDAGAVDFLFKPVDERILAHKANTFFELYRQRQLLQETLRFNEIFVAALSHDLRNPLSAIVTGIEALHRIVENPVEKRVVEAVRNSSKRMAAMLDQLFDLGRARLGGGIPLNRQPLVLADVCTALARELETTNGGHRVEVDSKGDTTAECDPEYVSRALSNLIANAARHGKPDHPIVVSIDGGHPDRVRIEVWNQGAIPADLIPTIFEPFKKGPAANTDGLGLGLYIVQQIVIEHGGRVDVVSSPEVGTRFTVSLPRSGRPDPAHPR